MPLPEAARDLPVSLAEAQAMLDAIDTSIAALPPVPVEADLPDIVQVVADVSAAVASLKAIVDTIATILGTTRINQ